MRQATAFFIVLIWTVYADAAPTYHARQGEVLILDSTDIGIIAKDARFTATVFGERYKPIVFRERQYMIIGVDFRIAPGEYQIQFWSGDRLTNTGKLEVAETKYDLTPKDPKQRPYRSKPSDALQNRRVNEFNAIRDALCCAVVPYDMMEVIPTGNAFRYPMDEIEIPPLIGCEFGVFRLWRNAMPSRHAGIDLRTRDPKNPWKTAPRNALAIADGEVVFTVKPPARPFDLQGYAVIVRHPGNIFAAYFHLSKVLVSVGQKVAQGQVLALTGATGAADGPHLHFAIVVKCATVDPLAAIRKFQEFFK